MNKPGEPMWKGQDVKRKKPKGSSHMRKKTATDRKRTKVSKIREYLRE